jgi:hypothetical protein
MKMVEKVAKGGKVRRRVLSLDGNFDGEHMDPLRESDRNS